MRTFEVSPVKPAHEPFGTSPAAERIREKERAIASACNAPELIQTRETMHPFLLAVALAYGQHHPLTLAPDDGGTLATFDYRYVPRGGPLGGVTGPLIDKMLKAMFADMLAAAEEAARGNDPAR